MENDKVSDSLYMVKVMNDDLASNAVLKYFIVEDT